MTTFRNEPILDLRRPADRDALTAALADLDTRLPLSVPVMIGGSARTGEDLKSVDPAQPSRVVALAASATPADVDAAVAAATEAARDWGRRPAAARADVLLRAAALLRRDRAAIAALMVREAGKPWPEADGDICEAIDFLTYYAGEAVRLESSNRLLQPPGERNVVRYRPRGVAAVIAPWNFPVAIATGMTAGALATGNTVILKPAEQTPACARVVVDALLAAGLPAGALSLLPGEGDVGAALVRHPGVHTVAFTGSAAVGLEILRVCASPAEGSGHLKHVSAEMGGKNCIIVDSDADLDDAVPGIVYSAFGFAGQKCSAASRVIVHESVAEPLRRRIAGAVDVLRVDLPERFGVDLGPVIDADAQERIRSYAQDAAAAGTTVAAGTAHPSGGYFCAPTVVADLPAAAPVLREEVFGPLLTVTAVPSIEAACDIVDELPFALTGGLFSRNPDTIARVVERTPVGNLYVNRNITGAMVGRQPFGGYRLSGTGSKAGGPDYLMHFVEARVVTENTVRHGLVV
jgi:RHH-type proline utilization regulon transcriptional repressor/proline dehydrogenase/delta 1-pyrroline-5-carboxylate dehydrogenase